MTWKPEHPEESGPRRVDASLGQLTRGLGMAGPGALRDVFGRWAEVVGPQIAAHARPVSLRERTLVVAVDQPGWATQLRYLEADLLGRLRDVAGAETLARIEVRVRPRG